MTKDEKRKAARKKYNDSENGKATRKKYAITEKGKEVLKASKKKYNKTEAGRKSQKQQGEKFRASEKGIKWYKEYSQLEATKARAREHMNKFYKTEEGKITVLFQNARARAKKNGRDFELTKEWIKGKLERGICEVTGIPFSYENKGHKNAPFTPSLDRKNPKLGYTKRNTQLICCFYNVLKWDWNKKTVKQILDILKTMK